MDNLKINTVFNFLKNIIILIFPFLFYISCNQTSNIDKYFDPNTQTPKLDQNLEIKLDKNNPNSSKKNKKNHIHNNQKLNKPKLKKVKKPDNNKVINTLKINNNKSISNNITQKINKSIINEINSDKDNKDNKDNKDDHIVKSELDKDDDGFVIINSPNPEKDNNYPKQKLNLKSRLYKQAVNLKDKIINKSIEDPKQKDEESDEYDEINIEKSKQKLALENDNIVSYILTYKDYFRNETWEKIISKVAKIYNINNANTLEGLQNIKKGFTKIFKTYIIPIEKKHKKIKYINKHEFNNLLSKIFKDENKTLTGLINKDLYNASFKNLERNSLEGKEDPNKIYYFISDNYTGYIRHDKENSTAYIYFNGTDSLSDLKRDLTANKVRIKGLEGQYHSGFTKLVLDVAPQIVSVLEDLQKKNKELKIIVSGHSLGAACSVLLSLLLIKKYNFDPKKTFVLAIAKPPIMDKEAAKFYNEILGKSTLVINQLYDPITKLNNPVYKYKKSIGTELILDFNNPYNHTLKDYFKKLNHINNSNLKLGISINY